jgi:hypothetical protein
MEKKVGKVIKVETEIQGFNNFVCILVKIDVRKVLACVVTISRGGQGEFY